MIMVIAGKLVTGWCVTVCCVHGSTYILIKTLVGKCHEDKMYLELAMSTD